LIDDHISNRNQKIKPIIMPVGYIFLHLWKFRIVAIVTIKNILKNCICSLKVADLLKLLGNRIKYAITETNDTIKTSRSGFLLTIFI